jgi:thioredoxin reductase (NADPH)
MDFELAIIGAGPAGFSASIYAVRAGIHTVLFDKSAGGGLAAIAPNIDNYPGFSSITGVDLAEKMKQHAKHYVDFHEYEEITSINKIEKGFDLISSEEKTYNVAAIILATGTSHRKLPVDDVEHLEGKGISYCATCDGFFFKDRIVAVIGGGNSALIESMYLKQVGCKKVYLIHRRDQLRAEEAYVKYAKKAGVEFILNTTIKNVIGTQQVESVELQDTKTIKTITLPVDGVFVSIGVMPHNTLAKQLGLDLDGRGYIKVDAQMRTSLPGVYSAGDITGGLRQVITAAGNGAVAALTSMEALGRQYPY